jgi:hypothetical protein
MKNFKNSFYAITLEIFYSEPEIRSTHKAIIYQNSDNQVLAQIIEK